MREILARVCLQQPFLVLVNHFVKRLFASEEEQGGSTIGFGVGSVLALLASPGAFASIFLMGKYSTLVAWIRGQHIDAIHRSPSDEYFFIVLSMTVTGLVMVSRWNRLFPNKRDFDNLAVLPIPIRNIFIANLAALLGMAVLFGIDVNLVSSVLFPLFVALNYETFSVFVHIAASHVTAVLMASFFSFFGVFALVGVLMLITPRRLFPAVSLAFRVGLTVFLLAQFSSNVLLSLFAGRLPGQAGHFLRWVPSYWFLAIYESMLGFVKAPMAELASVAGLALAGAIVVSLVSYSLCYRRKFLRLTESSDSLARVRRPRLSFPEKLAGVFFRSSFERACSMFTVKALFRSEAHLMFLGSYLGWDWSS
jgi:hypothetical protein